MESKQIDANKTLNEPPNENLESIRKNISFRLKLQII